MLKQSLVRQSLAGIMLFMLAALASAQNAAQDQVYKIGTVQASGRPTYTIAVPSFKAMGGTVTGGSDIHNIIYNDLDLSGFFQRVKDQGFVEETAARDQASGRVLFEEWSRLGAQYLVMGQYQAGAGSALTGEYRLISIADGKQITGKRYDFQQMNPRALAHRIADDIVQYLTAKRGIAGTKIVYVSRRGSSKEVYMIDPDGQNEHPVTRDNNLDATPCWGTNATEIYYTSFKDYNPDLCGVRVSSPDTSWWISRRQGFNLSPDFSPANKLIAVALGKDGNQEVYTMDRMGKNARRLTFNIGIDGSPSWSPEGNQIAFSSDRAHHGHPDVYVMEADGSNQRRLTTRNYYSDLPDWSPNGDKIVFSSQESKGDSFHIYTMGVDGSNWQQLTSGGSNNEDPSWAPDGEHIVFSSNRSGNYQLYIMNSNGDNLHQLTRSGENHSPDWSPYLP